MYKAIRRSSYGLYILSKQHAPHTPLRHISVVINKEKCQSWYLRSIIQPGTEDLSKKKRDSLGTTEMHSLFGTQIGWLVYWSPNISKVLNFSQHSDFMTYFKCFCNLSSTEN